MIRGTITFKCTNCKKTFRGLNVEYLATVFSMPVSCKHCNSIRTLPLSSYYSILPMLGIGKRYGAYEEIWKNIESRSKK